MKKHGLWLITVVAILILVATIVPAHGQDCGYPGCAYYVPTRVPIGEPLKKPAKLAGRIYLPFVTMESR